MSRFGSRGTRRSETRMVAAGEVQIDDRVKAVMEAEAAAKAEADGERQGRSCSSAAVGVTRSRLLLCSCTSTAVPGLCRSLV